MNKIAKEMFEELGYYLYSEQLSFDLLIWRKEKEKGSEIVVFNSEEEFHVTWEEYDGFDWQLIGKVNAKLQLAINQQIRELNWESWKGVV
jgi:hypothetical protein